MRARFLVESNPLKLESTARAVVPRLILMLPPVSESQRPFWNEMSVRTRAEGLPGRFCLPPTLKPLTASRK
ncbi:hypothetical protein D3C72_1434860 [compost metagenome]